MKIFNASQNKDDHNLEKVSSFILIFKHSAVLMLCTLKEVVLNFFIFLGQVGCEDGTVKLFEVHEGKIQFERNLAKQKGRIISLSWHPSGSRIAAGMMDMIRVFDTETGKL